MQIELRKCRPTYSLGGISWSHIRHKNWTQKMKSNSQAGWNFMMVYQAWKLSSEGAEQLTRWMEFHDSISGIQIELRKYRATHILSGILWWHVRHASWAQKMQSNSHAGWNFMMAYQTCKLTQKVQSNFELTHWVTIHNGISAIQIEVRRCRATHTLGGILQWHISYANWAQKVQSNSQARKDFIIVFQPWKLRVQEIHSNLLPRMLSIENSQYN